MNIINLTRSLDPNYGGTVTACKAYHQLFCELGYTSRIITLSQGFEIDDAEIGLGTCKNNFGFSIGFIPKILRLAKDCDCIFVHGLWQFHGFLALLCRLVLKCEIILVPHGMAATYFDRFRLKRLKKNIYWYLIESHVVNYSKYVVFMGEGEKNSASNYLISACENKALIIPPVFEVKPIKVTPNPSTLESFKMLIIARGHPIKGISDFLVEVNSLALNFSKRIAISIIGDHNQSFIEKSLLSNTNIDLCFKGALHGKQKELEISKCDCVVVPSKYESFGIVALEALALNRPVLISNEVGVGKDLYGCPLVYNYDIDSIESLKNAVIGLLSFKTTSGTYDIEEFLKIFSKREVSKKITDLLEGINVSKFGKV